jgi:hypothetical protein
MRGGVLEPDLDLDLRLLVNVVGGGAGAAVGWIITGPGAGGERLRSLLGGRARIRGGLRLLVLDRERLISGGYIIVTGAAGGGGERRRRSGEPRRERSDGDRAIYLGSRSDTRRGRRSGE